MADSNIELTGTEDLSNASLHHDGTSLNSERHSQSGSDARLKLDDTERALKPAPPSMMDSSMLAVRTSNTNKKNFETFFFFWNFS